MLNDDRSRDLFYTRTMMREYTQSRLSYARPKSFSLSQRKLLYAARFTRGYFSSRLHSISRRRATNDDDDDDDDEAKLLHLPSIPDRFDVF